jgi:hypothetical protein
MNQPIKAKAHKTKIRRWTTFTPPQSTPHAALCGLFLLRRAYNTPLKALTIGFIPGVTAIGFPRHPVEAHRASLPLPVWPDLHQCLLRHATGDRTPRMLPRPFPIEVA